MKLPRIGYGQDFLILQTFTLATVLVKTEKKSKFTDVIGRYYIGTKDVDFNNRIIYDNGIAIPLHLSIIGFDDIPIARYTDPQLTTVRYPIASMAKLATELALQGSRRAAGSWGDALLHANPGASTFRRVAANCGSDH